MNPNSLAILLRQYITASQNTPAITTGVNYLLVLNAIAEAIAAASEEN